MSVQAVHGDILRAVRDTAEAVNALTRLLEVVSMRLVEPAPLPTVSAPAPVVGKIDAQKNEIDEAIVRFERNLIARKRAPRTVQIYGALLRCAAREQGWTRFEHITPVAVSDYLDFHNAQGHWKGSTYQRTLSVFRSFSRWLESQGLLVYPNGTPRPDAIRAIMGPRIDDSAGSRAATDEDARRLLLHAFERGGSRVEDGLASDRLTYYACLFLAGCRFGEPARWTWSENVRLDEEIPFLLWTPGSNKSRHRLPVALHPDLAQLLRTHRASMRTLARTSPRLTRLDTRNRQRMEVVVDPDQPEAPVFPKIPSPATFRADCVCCGLRGHDAMGERFTAHSARKWFSTSMHEHHQRVVNYLMRHFDGQEMRYFKPDLKTQLSVLEALPKILPEDAIISVDMEGSASDDDAATTAMLTPPRDIPSPSRSGLPVVVADKSATGTGGIRGVSLSGNGHYRTLNVDTGATTPQAHQAVSDVPEHAADGRGPGGATDRRAKYTVPPPDGPETAAGDLSLIARIIAALPHDRLARVLAGLPDDCLARLIRAGLIALLIAALTVLMARHTTTRETVAGGSSMVP